MLKNYPDGFDLIVFSKYSFLSMFVFLRSAVSTFAADFNFVVSTDGTVDFRTVQEAINAVPDFRKNETRVFITIIKNKLKIINP